MCSICIRSKTRDDRSRLCDRCADIYTYSSEYSGFYRRGRMAGCGSRGERAVADTLRFLLPSATIIRGFRPDWCLSEKGVPLEFDFLVPELDLAIEYNGIQHYVLSPWFDGRRAKRKLREREERDRRKREKANIRGIAVLTLSYKEKITPEAVSILIQRCLDERVQYGQRHI